MFKFMKSKKGFTLVELMIVVVIMAILVAVAVPIYNAVTENARKKTCAANRRNIISQITNNAMSDPSLIASAVGDATALGDAKTMEIETSADGETAVLKSNAIFNDSAEFFKLFNDKNRPICPIAGSILTVKAYAVNAKDVSSLKVVVTCSAHPDAA